MTFLLYRLVYLILDFSGSSKMAIKDSDKVSFGNKLAFGAGGAVDWLMTGLISRLFMPVFNLGFGIAPGNLSLILMFYRGWDAITDPIMGNISDNTRSKYGRRRPYIFLGAILTALVTPLLWRPNPEWGEFGMVIYITIIGLVAYTASTIWAMPYNSMMLEMTPDYDERTRLSAYKAIFCKLGVLCGGWVLPIAASSYFANKNGEADIVNGVQQITAALVVVVICLGLLPALFIKEKYYEKEASKQEKVPLIQGLKDSLKIKPLWVMVGFVVFQVFGSGLTSALGFYINTYYINEGVVKSAAFLEGIKETTAFATGLIAIPFWTWVCEKIDKKYSMMIIIASGFIGCGLNFLCLNPRYPYLQIVPAVFYASVVASMWLILPSMLADIVDYDELDSHMRREGLINAVFSWFLKLGMTCSVGLSGFILEWTGFDSKLGKTQDSSVLNNMVLAYIFLPVIFWSISLFLLYKYPLDRKKMSMIRTELEARRGTV